MDGIIRENESRTGNMKTINQKECSGVPLS
jgi:hypothetical protein